MIENPVVISTGIVPLIIQLLIKIPMRKNKKAAPSPDLAPATMADSKL
jgi:hypothetical protein